MWLLQLWNNYNYCYALICVKRDRCLHLNCFTSVTLPFLGSESHFWQHLVVPKIKKTTLIWEGEEMLEQSSAFSSCLSSAQLRGPASQPGLWAAGGLATQPRREISPQKIGTLLDFKMPNLRCSVLLHIAEFQSWMWPECNADLARSSPCSCTADTWNSLGLLWFQR